MNTAHQHMTDAELLSRYSTDHNKDWLGILLSRYTTLLLGVCLKYVKDEDIAKDIVQQVFIKALNEINKQKIDNFGGWLYRVAKNECLNEFRKKNHLTSDDELNYLEADNTFTIQEHLNNEQRIVALQQAITELKEEQRICIELFYLQEKSYQEIVELTTFDMKQVKSNIQNGKRNLKLKLEH